MPGWHEATEALQKQGKVQVAGLIQEQHQDRCRLFMQWKKMDWPIMVDSLNLLSVSAVPITLFIDEYGIVRAYRPKHGELQAFLAAKYPEPAGWAASRTSTPDLKKLKAAAQSGRPDAARAYGDALVMWEREQPFTQAVAVYRKALQAAPADGPLHFRLGVAYRKRYDSPERQEGDFHKAVESWGKALAINPNMYIWRRRIQQYGPRLDKPYPFYDWVPRARTDVKARGEKPAPLIVEPGGAEFANPSREFKTETGTVKDPDPKGKINRDKEAMIKVETVAVPATGKKGKVWRVHIAMYPDAKQKAHWNNEAEPLLLWVYPPEHWTITRRSFTAPHPKTATSDETRTIEFEVKAPNEFTGGASLKTYALYYTCEGQDGVCMYLRRDIEVRIP